MYAAIKEESVHAATKEESMHAAKNEESMHVAKNESVHKAICEESFDDNSSSNDNPDCDLFLGFNSQQSHGRKRHETTMDGSTKLGSNKRKINTNYSHDEALIVAKNLRDESTVNEALFTLKTWLEKGECTKQTAGNFFSLIQGVCSHVNCLQKKKEDCKERISKSESELMQYVQSYHVMFDIIKTIFNLAQEEKVQNLFTEAQKNNIKKSRGVIEKCQEELKGELTFCNNGSTSKDNFRNSNNVKGVNISSKQEEMQKEIEKLREEKMKFCSQLAVIQEEKKKLQSQLTASIKEPQETANCASNIDISSSGIQRQAHLIAVISPFLFAHHNVGQTLDVILSYLKSLGFHICEQEVEDILVRNSSIFQSLLCENESSMEKRWIFCGYQR